MAKEKSSRYVIGLTIFMGLVGLLDQFLSQVEGPIMVYILADYGVSAADFAFWQGIFGVITFLVFLISYAFDRLGRKKGILILILTLGIPALIIAIPMNLYLFLLFYSILIMGTLSNGWEIPIVEEAPAEKRGIYGSITFLIGLIPLFAILAVPIAESLGWRWAYGVMFFFALILLIPWYFMRETPRWLTEREKLGKKLGISSALKTLKRKDWIYILFGIIVYIIWTICYIMIRSWCGYYYVTYQGYTTSQYSTILLIGALLTMVGAILGGVLMDKFGRNVTLLVACIGSFIGILLVPTGIVIFFWIMYLCFPIILGYLMVYYNEIFPTNIRGTAIGVENTISRVGYIIGPLIASLLLTFFDNPQNKMVGFFVVGAILILVPLFILFTKPYETKGQELEAIQEGR
ncbi:MAG: MFS transporter [Promethearchaeota archaeon]